MAKEKKWGNKTLTPRSYIQYFRPFIAWHTICRYLSGFLFQIDRSNQVRTIETARLGLSKGWPRTLERSYRLIEVKIAEIKRHNFRDLDN